MVMSYHEVIAKLLSRSFHRCDTCSAFATYGHTVYGVFADVERRFCDLCAVGKVVYELKDANLIRQAIVHMKEHEDDWKGRQR